MPRPGPQDVDECISDGSETGSRATSPARLPSGTSPDMRRRGLPVRSKSAPALAGNGRDESGGMSLGKYHVCGFILWFWCFWMVWSKGDKCMYTYRRQICVCIYITCDILRIYGFKLTKGGRANVDPRFIRGYLPKWVILFAPKMTPRIFNHAGVVFIWIWPLETLI